MDQLGLRWSAPAPRTTMASRRNSVMRSIFSIGHSAVTVPEFTVCMHFHHAFCVCSLCPLPISNPHFLPIRLPFYSSTLFAPTATHLPFTAKNSSNFSKLPRFHIFAVCHIILCVLRHHLFSINLRKDTCTLANRSARPEDLPDTRSLSDRLYQESPDQSSSVEEQTSSSTPDPSSN
jgi:hypothetical protein